LTYDATGKLIKSNETYADGTKKSESEGGKHLKYYYENGSLMSDQFANNDLTNLIKDKCLIYYQNGSVKFRNTGDSAIWYYNDGKIQATISLDSTSREAKYYFRNGDIYKESISTTTPFPYNRNLEGYKVTSAVSVKKAEATFSGKRIENPSVKYISADPTYHFDSFLVFKIISVSLTKGDDYKQPCFTWEVKIDKYRFQDYFGSLPE
jgi:hypothetical protein